MPVNSSRWHAALLKWRTGFKKHYAAITKQDTRRLITAGAKELWKTCVSIALNGVLLVTGWFFFNFLGASSTWFWITIVYMLVVYAFFKSKFYLTSVSAFAALFILVPLISVSASFYIASDQLQLRYRTVEGVSYLEFPGKSALLRSIAGFRAGSHFVDVIKCGDATVAKLPLLTYKPIYPEKGIIDAPFAFRRFPNLRFERIELNVEASIGTATLPNGEKKQSFSAAFGFPSNDPAEISLTDVFPRSIGCMENSVPLLPIIEVLPWDPNDTISLIRAVIRVDHLRRMYPGGVISLESLSQLRMPDDTGQYKALFDFLIYSLEYRVFAGNVFARVRADLGNKLCVIAQNRQSAFLGPFSSFSENFYRQIAGELGPKYKTVYPACQISDELLRSYQELKTYLNPIPFLATFQSCLTTASSLRECLANDDVATNCIDQPCTSKPSEGELFEIYDDSFSEIVARKENTLAEISTIRPDECPELRDSQEEREFVLWWLAHANKILTEPAQCLSTAWQSNYFRSLEEERKTFACAAQRGIRDIQDPLGFPTLLDTLFKFKCGGTVNVSKTDIGKTLYHIFDQSEHLSVKLERVRAFIGSRETDAIISALQKFARLKQAICGTLDEKSCVEEYTVWQNFPGLASQASGIVDASIFDGGPRQILENLTRLDNILVDMGICDLLQDKEFSTRTGYDRETYCDDHGLKAYRLVGSKALGHSVERGEVSSNGGAGYFYDSHGSSSNSVVKVPLGN